MSTFSQFKVYMSAAQTAFAAGSYDTARQQLILAEMELAKIPDIKGSNEEATFRENIAQIRAGITDVQARASSRRNQMQFGTITPAATGPGAESCR